MQRLVELCNASSPAWMSLLVSGVWQSTLLAAVIALVALGLRRASPDARYWLWQIVPLKLLVLFVWSWSLPVSLPETWVEQVDLSANQPAHAASAAIRNAPAGKVATIAAKKSPGSTPAVTVGNVQRGARKRATAFQSEAFPTLNWQSWLMLAWGAVVLLQVARLVRQRNRLSQLLAEAEPAGEPLVAAVRRAAGQLGLDSPPLALLTEQDCSPFVCGILRPRLIVPRSLADALAPAELAQVVLHELAHLKRRDLVWAWLAETARVAYFFHPVMHWVCARIRLERELACDQLAIAHSGGTASDYAAMLVRVLTVASRADVFRAVAAAGLDGGQPLSAELRAHPPESFTEGR